MSVPFTFMIAVVGVFGVAVPQAHADPCGMVPPIYNQQIQTIKRVGLQRTYVFHRRGVETFVIQPGFTGNVKDFGMLIPFPNPPAIRKVADNVFEQIADAIDPPEVVVDIRPRRGGGGFGGFAGGGGGGFGGGGMGGGGAMILRDQVRVVRQEAVGMYEVAVLEAGSAAALKKWMDSHGYAYPKGMDEVAEDYVKEGWCFVAVKTKVAGQKGVQPKPGQRSVDSKLPNGTMFDGAVQAMGFRFRTRKLVVPMRLGVFNEGDNRNVVYLLTEDPKKINLIPEEFVVRQLSGKQLYDNLTEPLPVRVIGGKFSEIPRWQKTSLAQRRDPAKRNGVAKELFADDLLASGTKVLSLKKEDVEKEYQRIGEYFKLRGQSIDRLNHSVAIRNDKTKVHRVLKPIERMTLTVVDGDFPRDVLAKQNLTFSSFKMAQKQNNKRSYDAKLYGPNKKKVEGRLYYGAIHEIEKLDRFEASLERTRYAQARPNSDKLIRSSQNVTSPAIRAGMLLSVLSLSIFGSFLVFRFKNRDANLV